jgi:short subunit dehydrogenase-like uncharacterized protein
VSGAVAGTAGRRDGWLLYGANGYTGELIAREAVRRGLRPVLAGRNAQAIEALGRELACPVAVLGLDDADALVAALRGVRAVLHCAGPFSATAQPMLRACLAAGAHYLDITGEIDVFEAAHALDAQARAAGVVLCPGVGFDVVPTDCVAARLAAGLPDATYLALGFHSSGRPSRGTARTSIEGLASGGRIRSSGRIVAVEHAFRSRDIDFGDGKTRSAVTIPWGDVSTAYHSTGIPNIEVYMSMPAERIAQLRRANRLRRLLRLGFVQARLKARAARGAPGPDAAARERSPTLVWGEAQAPSGATLTATLKVGNGYEVTVHAALGVLERLLTHGADGLAGHRTPSQLVGSGFVETLPGSGRMRLEPGRAWEPRAT